MKRLTDNEFHTKENKEQASHILEPRLQQIYDKLFELEDLEESLGVELPIFVSALRRGIYVKTKNGIEFCSVCLDYTCDCYNEWLSNYRDIFVLPSLNTYVELYDYGKTWSLDKNDLTKEELVNEH